VSLPSLLSLPNEPSPYRQKSANRLLGIYHSTLSVLYIQFLEASRTEIEISSGFCPSIGHCCENTVKSEFIFKEFSVKTHFNLETP
jgi:hypothetical protein